MCEYRASTRGTTPAHASTSPETPDLPQRPPPPLTTPFYGTAFCRHGILLLSGASPASWAKRVGQGGKQRGEKHARQGIAWCGEQLLSLALDRLSWRGWTSKIGMDPGTQGWNREISLPSPGRIFSPIHCFLPHPTSPPQVRSPSPSIRTLTIASKPAPSSHLSPHQDHTPKCSSE